MWRQEEIEKTLSAEAQETQKTSSFIIRTQQDDVLDFILENDGKWTNIKEVYDQFPDIPPQKLIEWIDIFTIRKLVLYFKDSVRKYSEEEDEKIPKGLFYWKYKK